MKKTILLFLIFSLSGCESYFFDQYKIIKPKIYKKVTQYYKVKKGDNLYSISRKFNIPIQKIIKSNKIKSPFKIFPNQKIFLPRNKVYSVIKGDTLYSISRKFKTDLYSLSVLNKLDNINQIKVNQKILIPDVVLNVKKNKKKQKITKKKDYKEKNNQKKINTSNKKVSNFIWPVKGKILNSFGSETPGFFNDGINISSNFGTFVKASLDGEIVYSGNEIPGYGNLILIKHSQNWITAYAHLEKILKYKGNFVKKGEKIGLVGNTGNVREVQLHFEIRKGKEAVNPLKYLS